MTAAAQNRIPGRRKNRRPGIFANLYLIYTRFFVISLHFRLKYAIFSPSGSAGLRDISCRRCTAADHAAGKLSESERMTRYAARNTRRPVPAGTGVWRAISSIANLAPTTRSKNCSGSISAVRGQNLTRFLNKCIVRNPRHRYSPHAGDFLFHCFAGAKSAEALQTPNDCAICALKPRLHLLHGTAYVKHLHQGGFIRLRPRLARIGQWCRPLRPVRHIPQHAMQRADDLQPVADTAGRQTLARQRVDAVRQLGQQCFCLLQFHRHAPPFHRRVCGGSQISSCSQSSLSDRPQMNGSVIASSTECASTA